MRTVDLNILKLLELLKQTGTIRYNQEFVDAIGLHKQHLVSIRAGKQSFTVEHIAKVCKQYQVDANLLLSDEQYTIDTFKPVAQEVAQKSNDARRSRKTKEPV